MAMEEAFIQQQVQLSGILKYIQPQTLCRRGLAAPLNSGGIEERMAINHPGMMGPVKIYDTHHFYN